MMDFIEIPATNKSIAFRKPICGVGKNDAGYLTGRSVNGKRTVCPYYSTWHSMLVRCYSDKYHTRQPTYKDCTVCEEWLLFSNFKAWMINQDWQNKQLDKDLLIKGNKIYSPVTCIFVSSQINSLLTDNKLSRGLYRQGVVYIAKSGKFLARCSLDGLQKHIGSFDTEDKAFSAYKEYKYKVISNIAQKKNKRLKQTLLDYVII